METLRDTGYMIKLINDAIVMKANLQLKERELTWSQMRVLAFLGRRRGEAASQKELEKAFTVSHPTMIGILKRLENKGFIQSSVNTRDKRLRDISLTEKGTKVQNDMCGKSAEMERIIHRGLSESQVDQLSEMLNTVYRNINASY